MIPTSLVVGASGLLREQAIADLIAQQASTEHSAVLLEGLSSGHALLETLQHVVVMRIAPGCLCCSNQLIMRTYLNRLIQQRPDRLYISLANHQHLDQIQHALRSDSYENVLASIDVVRLADTDV